MKILKGRVVKRGENGFSRNINLVVKSFIASKGVAWCCIFHGFYFVNFGRYDFDLAGFM